MLQSAESQGNDFMGFKEKIAKLRKERGLSIKQLAELVGVNSSQIVRYESGKNEPTLSVIKNMAKILGVSADELIFNNKDGVAASKLDPELLRKFQEISLFPEREKDAIKVLIDSVIARIKMQELIETEKVDK